ERAKSSIVLCVIGIQTLAAWNPCSHAPPRCFKYGAPARDCKLKLYRQLCKFQRDLQNYSTRQFIN
ncbi:hypothetical protein, partial [Mesorhizobium sp. M8A.F.Ca.ET.167.01.1.1]|uniref:hypothetical protein n=1 Tax=Mesorhizobium sp. M8A.F.Ca.ET.167.01.1.1 TaxID=2563961 RepID=UPI001AEE964E